MDNPAKRPLHLWIVGLLSTVWNGFGAFDYLMTQTDNEAYLAQFTDPQRIYFQSFPLWMEAAWALGVWGALAGSLLLLLRSRHAMLAFGISLVGLLVSTIYQYGLASPPADMMTGGMIAMNIAIWVIAIALLLYARQMRAKGSLR